jgi:hypothetical protein
MITSGVQSDQLKQYFPTVNTIHDLKIHLGGILANRAPTTLIPHMGTARRLAKQPTLGEQKIPPAACVSAHRTSKQAHQKHTTPMAILKIVERFHPVPNASHPLPSGTLSKSTSQALPVSKTSYMVPCNSKDSFSKTSKALHTPKRKITFST